MEKSSSLILWHTRLRFWYAFAITLLAFCIAISAYIFVGRELGVALLLWAIYQAVGHLRPWFYSRYRNGQIPFRGLISILGLIPFAWFLLPKLGFSLIGFVIAIAFVLFFLILQWPTVRILLHPRLVADQPPMSVLGALGRFGFVLYQSTVEELFYRYYLTSVLLSAGLSIPLTTLASVSMFVIAEISGGWGPLYYSKVYISHFLLGVVWTLVYIYTGSILVCILTHWVYNSAQLLLPIINVMVHRLNLFADFSSSN